MIKTVITVKIDSILQEMRQIMIFITYISFLDIHFAISETDYSFKDIFTIVINQIHRSTKFLAFITQVPKSINKLLTITQAVIAYQNLILFYKKLVANPCNAQKYI